MTAELYETVQYGMLENSRVNGHMCVPEWQWKYVACMGQVRQEGEREVFTTCITIIVPAIACCAFSDCRRPRPPEFHPAVTHRYDNEETTGSATALTTAETPFLLRFTVSVMVKRVFSQMRARHAAIEAPYENAIGSEKPRRALPSKRAVHHAHGAWWGVPCLRMRVRRVGAGNRLWARH